MNEIFMRDKNCDSSFAIVLHKHLKNLIGQFCWLKIPTNGEYLGIIIKIPAIGIIWANQGGTNE